MSLATIIFSLAISYLIGAIPTSYLLARWLRKIDIREHGSRNVGATNIFRVVGKLPGIAALVIDAMKGVVCVTVLPALFWRATQINPDIYKILLGSSSIAGHVWPVYLGFKGGKGVATTAGAMLILAPSIFLTGFIVWIAVFAIFRYVSLASIISGLALPIAALAFNKPFSMVLFCITLCIIGSYKHRSNIKRLIYKEEKKLF